MLYALTYVEGNEYLRMNGKEVVKVGYSDNWKKRIEDYGVGYHCPKNGYIKKSMEKELKLFATIFDDYANRGAETIIHRALRKHSVWDTQKCEWYVVSEEFKEDLSLLFHKDIRWDYKPLKDDDEMQKEVPKNPARFVSEAVVKTLRSLDEDKWYSVKDEVHSIFLDQYEGDTPPPYQIINARLREAFSDEAGPIWRTALEVNLQKEKQKGRGVCIKRASTNTKSPQLPVF